LKELESTLVAWFKQSRESNISVDGTHLKEKALHIANCLGLDNFCASNGWIDRFKRRHNITYKVLSGESKSVDQKTVEQWKNEILLQKIRGYDLCDIYNADETGLFFNLQPSHTLDFRGNPCHGGTKSKQRVTVLLACNADGTDKLPPMVIGKYKNPRCFKNVRTLPTKYEANKNSWITAKLFEDYLIHLDRKMGGKNRKILLFIDQCAAHPKNVFLRNIEVVFLPAHCTSTLQPLDLGIIHAFKFHYRKLLVRKTVAMVDGGLLQDATKMKLSVLHAMNFIAEAWRLITPCTIKNCFAKCGFLGCCNTSNDDSYVNLSESEENDWNSLQIYGVNFDDYVRCDSPVTVCEVQTVEQIISEQLHYQEEELEEEDEVEEEKIAFIDALKGLDTVKKYICKFDNENNVVEACNKVEHEMYRLRALEKTKQITLVEWLKK
jgi:hypothetical protein